MKFSSIHLFCLSLIQAILCEKLLERTKPFKPFISVLSKESIKSLEEKSNKFISFEEDLNEKFGDEAEDKLRKIKASVKCFYVDDFTLYDIKGLGKNPLKEKEKFYTADVDGKTVYYNFCQDLEAEDGCNSTASQVKIKDGDNCISLTKRIGIGNHWSILDNKTKTIEIELNQEEDSKNLVKYILECDKDVTNPQPIDGSYYKKTENGTEIVLHFKTKEACPTADFYVFWKFLMDFKLIFGIILIVAGLFECILGKKLMKITAFILSCAAVVIVSMIFLMEFIVPPGTASWIIWIMLIISAAIGIYLGYVIAKYDDKVLSLLVGGVGGFFLGEFLYNLFGNRIDLKPLLVNILFVLCCILILIIIALVVRTAIIIFCTSFIGSYAAIRGISFFAGNFPSEFTVMDIIAAGEEGQIDQLLNLAVYLYIVSIIVLTGIGIFIQYKINSDDKFKNSDDTDDNLVDN